MYYISQTTFPSSKANAIQQLKMCQSFVKAGEPVTLVYPRSAGTSTVSWEELASMYGLTNKFEVVGVPSLKGRFEMVPQIGFFSLGISVAGWVCQQIFRGRITDADVVYSRNYYGAYILSELSKILPTSHQPQIFTEYHNLYTHRRFSNRFFQIVDGVVSITELLQNDLINTYPLSPEKCFVAPDGVDIEQYRDVCPIEARERVGIPRQEFVVMYTGHLYPRKGAQLLVEASPDIDGVVYIVGGYERDVKRIKSRYVIPENVRFTGFIEPSEIPYYQYSADVLVAPYTSAAHRHISPLKLFEYMATGVPIIASDHQVLHEVLRDGKNALIVEQDDPDAIASAIANLRSEPELAESIGERASRDVEQYSWQCRAEAILEFIDKRTG